MEPAGCTAQCSEDTTGLGRTLAGGCSGQTKIPLSRVIKEDHFVGMTSESEGGAPSLVRLRGNSRYIGPEMRTGCAG